MELKARWLRAYIKRLEGRVKDIERKKATTYRDAEELGSLRLRIAIARDMLRERRERKK